MCASTSSVLSPYFSFFFTDTATTEIYTLSLHDALPISLPGQSDTSFDAEFTKSAWWSLATQIGVRGSTMPIRSEEHTSELQSRQYLVCRLLLEKKKKKKKEKKNNIVERAINKATRIYNI